MSAIRDFVRPTLRCLVSLSILTAIFGCSRPVQQTEVAGLYIANNGHENDRIQINPDGSYLHTVTRLDGGTAFQNSNVWTFQIKEDGARILFHDFLVDPSLFPATAPKWPRGYWDLPVRMYHGTLRLLVHPDVETFYVKQKGN